MKNIHYFNLNNYNGAIDVIICLNTRPSLFDCGIFISMILDYAHLQKHILNSNSGNATTNIVIHLNIYSWLHRDVSSHMDAKELKQQRKLSKDVIHEKMI